MRNEYFKVRLKPDRAWLFNSKSRNGVRPQLIFYNNT